MIESSAASAYVQMHAISAGTLDPAAPLDDLEPLREIVQSARVVAIGENTHHVREFLLLRHRLTRFLAERCGFTHFAMEAPFCEGLTLADWVDGAPGDLNAIAASALSFRMGECAEMRDHLCWMRSFNERSSLRYAGIDPPQTLGSLSPALRFVHEYVAKIETDAASLVSSLIAVADSYAGANLSEVVPGYSALALAERQDLTARLSVLLSRFRYLRPLLVSRSTADDYEVALRVLESAVCLDHYLREMSAVWGGKPMFAEGSGRDAFMAETVMWLLDRGGPETRIVLAAHNAHIQRIPWIDDGHYMQGYYLAQNLGDQFVSLAATGGAGTTVRLDRDPITFEAIAEPAALEPPAEGSVEALFAGSQSPLTLLDLRPARTEGLSLGKLRMAEFYLDLPLADAFDGVLYLPSVSPTSIVANDWR